MQERQLTIGDLPMRWLDFGGDGALARDLNAEIDVIKRGKHFVPEDHPDRIAGAVRSAIKEATG